MLTETFRAIATATRRVLNNWRSMLLLAVVYAFLLASLYFFLVVREASLLQVTLTFALAILAPLLFFLLQAMIVASIAGGEEPGLSSLIKRSMTSFWKLILVTLPLIAVAVLVAYLLGKAQARLGASVPDVAADVPRRMVEGAREAAKPIDWKVAMISTVRYLTFGLVLPLAAIHLWLATVQEGLGLAIKRAGALISRAFAPQSVLIYIAGFLVFGVIPYFMLLRSVPSKNAWLELFLLVARLTVVFGLTLFGWVITVKALANLSTNSTAGAIGHSVGEVS
jgi:hypothetical protein